MMMGSRGRSATYVAQRGQIIHRRCTAARPILIGPHLENNKTLLHELKVDRIKDSGHEISAKHNRTHLHTLARRKRTLNSQIRTNGKCTLARRTSGALTYETVGAATPWRREQRISATRAAKRRPSTRCKRRAKLRLDSAALRLVRVAFREWRFRWVAVGDAKIAAPHGDTHTKYESVGI